MESKNNKLLLALRNSGADKIFEAYQWLQDHRGDLKKEVYGPVLIEVTATMIFFFSLLFTQKFWRYFMAFSYIYSQVNVQDQGHAAYLENHVPNYIWKV